MTGDGRERAVLDLFETADVLAVTLDRDGRITSCNRFLAEVTGWSAEDLIGRDYFATFEPERGENAWPEMLARASAREGATSFDDCTVVHTRDGGHRLVAWCDAVVREDDGTVVGSVSIGQDITDRSRAESELRLLVERQAALLRVARLVASEPGAERIFAAVTEEVAHLFGAQYSTTTRFGNDRRGVVVGGWSGVPGRAELAGTVVDLDDETAVAEVARTGRAVRVDDFSATAGRRAEHLRRELGVRASMAAPIVLGGRLWGAIAAGSTGEDPFPPGAEERMAEFGALIAQALANAEAAEALTASRARLVAAADAERRRLERNLHDGAQQRLVGLALALRLAEARVHADPDAAVAGLQAARAELAEALDELRELARGLHPAVLSDHGLRAALPALAGRCTVPVDVTVDVRVHRLPEPVELAAWFVVSESLANVAKYAEATGVAVRATRSGERLEVTVVDDGVGGADASRGSGLQGLADRVEALGGRLLVSSPPGEGTRVEVRLPVAPRGAEDDVRPRARRRPRRACARCARRAPRGGRGRRGPRAGRRHAGGRSSGGCTAGGRSRARA